MKTRSIGLNSSVLSSAKADFPRECRNSAHAPSPSDTIPSFFKTLFLAVGHLRRAVRVGRSDVHRSPSAPQLLCFASIVDVHLSQECPSTAYSAEPPVVIRTTIETTPHAEVLDTPMYRVLKCTIFHVLSLMLR